MERDGTARNGTNRCGTERKWAGRAGISYAPAALTSPPFFGKPVSDAPFSRAAGVQNCPPPFSRTPGAPLILVLRAVRNFRAIAFSARLRRAIAPPLFSRACVARTPPFFRRAYGAPFSGACSALFPPFCFLRACGAQLSCHVLFHALATRNFPPISLARLRRAKTSPVF